ncbi:MAG: response regulator receiver domain with sensory domain [Acidobacteria bacterium]|nr:response regulator receiver domain with sensory domain [Acidobacteriota bacterium]
MNQLKPVILCVDDEEANLKLLEKLLVPRGYVVVSAVSGKDALLKIKSQTIDLVLLDIIMPGMNGFEVCRQIKEDQKLRNIPVIMITASILKQDRIRGIEAGAEEFLSKPFDLAEVLARIKMLLKMKKLDDERKRAEGQREAALAELQKSHDELDRRVRERTAELAQANEILQADIIERQRAEEVLRKNEIRYRELFENMGSGVSVYETRNNGEDFIFKEYNAAAEMIDKTSREQSIGRSVVDVFPGVKDFGLFDVFQRVCRTGKSERFPATFYKDEKISGWRENYVYKLPSGEVVSVFDDVTESKQAEKILEQTMSSLKKAVGATIQVLVSAVEARDPYTAGHQLRSANLAGAIAAEMGLDQEKIDGIRMAGSIHDIGKLSVPTEILTKSARLTKIEFSMIKEHCQAGYEMVKDVESSWPLAQIIYQHHERMNGTGYPRNLKGDEILMEARIMAVADVVEAMASHRPYRPPLGIETALTEIEKNKGTLYDNAPADACLRLFRDKGYMLSLYK